MNEGPQALVRGDAVHVVYSAGASWTDDYCLGLLTARAGADLLAPGAWRKAPAPVFASGNGVFGPGHCAFAASPDGREDWVVYHAARTRGSGWDRNVRMQPFGWGADGAPRFGSPAGADAPIRLPGGEPARRRYEAEAARVAEPARVARRPGASGGAAVAGLDAGGAVEFDVRAATAGPHGLAVRYATAAPGPAAATHRVTVNGGPPATHRVTVNGGPPATVRYEPGGRADWSVAPVRVDLAAGPNRVRFAAGDGAAEIDCVDVVPAGLAKD